MYSFSLSNVRFLAKNEVLKISCFPNRSKHLLYETNKVYWTKMFASWKSISTEIFRPDNNFTYWNEMQLFPKKKNEREISHNTLKKFKFCMLSAKKIRCLIQGSMSLITDLKLGVIHFSSMKFSFLLPKNSELDAHQSRCRMSNRLYVRN